MYMYVYTAHSIMCSYNTSPPWAAIYSYTCCLFAQEADLSTTMYLSTGDMEDYAEKTFSSLLYLTLEAMGEYCPVDMGSQLWT